MKPEAGGEAGRRRRPLKETLHLIEEEGATGLAVPSDATSQQDVARLVDTVVQRLGGLHIAVNNAGILGRPGPWTRWMRPAGPKSWPSTSQERGWP